MLLHVTTCYYMLLHVTSCYYMLLRVATCYYVLLRVTTFYYVLLHVTTCYYVLLRVTTSYYVLLRVTTCYYMLLRVTTCYYVLLHVTTCYYVLLRVTTCYYMLLRVTTCYYVLLRVTACYYLLLHVTTCYYRLLHGTTWYYLHVTTFYYILLHGTTCYYMLLHVTTCYYMLLHVTTCYYMLPHVTTCYYMLLLVTTCYYMLLHVTTTYWNHLGMHQHFPTDHFASSMPPVTVLAFSSKFDLFERFDFQNCARLLQWHLPCTHRILHSYSCTIVKTCHNMSQRNMLQHVCFCLPLLWLLLKRLYHAISLLTESWCWIHVICCVPSLWMFANFGRAKWNKSDIFWKLDDTGHLRLWVWTCTLGAGRGVSACDATSRAASFTAPPMYRTLQLAFILPNLVCGSCLQIYPNLGTSWNLIPDATDLSCPAKHWLSNFLQADAARVASSSLTWTRWTCWTCT